MDHRRREEVALCRRFGVAQLNVQSDLQNTTFQEELSDAHQALRNTNFTRPSGWMTLYGKDG